MDNTVLAYLAGAMDADGCFTIKRSTQRKNNRGDCRSVVYFPRILFGQIQPTVCELLKETFGGTVSIQKPGTKNSKPMYKYQGANHQAAEACKSLLPFLRLKGERAEVLIEFDKWRTNPNVRKPTFWWVNENPDWANGSLLTSEEVMDKLGYSHPTCISQAISNGLLLALPYRHNRWAPPPRRFPQGLVDFLATLQGESRGKKVGYKLPPQYMAECHRFYEKVRAMNSLGVNGTCVNHRTGHYVQNE